ncbi:MAG: nucleoside-diphosphate kinase [Candidatus Micrarchaeota archaeon]
MMEQTLVILKPDCMGKGLAGKVVSRFEEAGLTIAGMKMASLSDGILDEHYAHLADKPFFTGLKAFMKSSPVVLMVLRGEGAVEKVRAMCGPTDSKNAAKGTIRGDYGEDVQRNIVHASDSKETAEIEVARFFKPDELFGWSRPQV